jgi:hypothetical protein
MKGVYHILDLYTLYSYKVYVEGYRNACRVGNGVWRGDKLLSVNAPVCGGVREWQGYNGGIPLTISRRGCHLAAY